jgi:Cytidine and deoxycytidylate deaminase zinc-binding region
MRTNTRICTTGTRHFQVEFRLEVHRLIKEVARMPLNIIYLILSYRHTTTSTRSIAPYPTYMTMESHTLSTQDRERLIQAAIEGMLNPNFSLFPDLLTASSAKSGAYTPYSKFRVGAALLTPDGQIIKGANVENSSYGLSLASPISVK